MQVILASQSPRRLELLRGIGLAPEVRPAGVDETLQAGEAPAASVLRLARLKARAVAPQAPSDSLIVAADTVVVSGGAALGKPVDRIEQRRMLEQLSGRTHEVLTGVCLIDRASSGEASDVGITRVSFSLLDAVTLDWYVASGEGLDKAGGYAVQGLAALFIPHLHGSWSNVVGLPLELCQRLAQSLGRDLRPAGTAGA